MSTNKSPSKTPPAIHLWSPESFHSESYIVGNYEGLVKLRAVIDNAIQQGSQYGKFFISDGEGYNLHVFRFDNITLAAVPYRDEIAEEHRERTLFPWDMVVRK